MTHPSAPRLGQAACAGAWRIALALALSLALPALAATVVKTEHVEARLVAERPAAAPGKPVAVGLHLRMAPHWHTYWKNPGDSGLPTRIRWTLPEGWKASDISWPHPKPLPVGPLLNFGYEDEVLLLVDLTPPKEARPGPVAIKANADWLVCKEICIPEKGELDIALAVAAAEPAVDRGVQALFESTRRQLPVEPPGLKAQAGVSGRKLTIRIEAPAGTALPSTAFFFPVQGDVVEHPVPQKLTREANALRIEMTLVDPPPAGLKAISGVVVAEGGWSAYANRKAIAVAADVGAPLPALAGTSTAGSSEVGGSIVVALLFALAGGLLLNLMPCVFPVLGIKVMGFVRHAHGDTMALRIQGLVFALGVVLSFLVLAGVMLALRSAGGQIGWGFQLQSPQFVALLAALFFVLALNLSGVFEWGLFAQSMTSEVSAKGRYADAFLAGVLATVVATPCTAPFMGAAVGFTLAQPAHVSLAIFAALGIGMGLPVYLLAHFPALLQRLPRPGAWMETFKQLMAFPLYATVAWLVWVLGAQAGNDAVLALLAGLVAIAIAAWIYGRWSQSASAWRIALVAVFGVLGLYLSWPGASTQAPAAGVAAAKPGELPWQAWSPERVAQLTAAGTPVFVDFTAAWCVTCQVNKRVALNHGGVVSAFTERGVVPLKADWTNHDPRITATLAALGRNAVPVYALYAPGEDSPRLLPELLTPSIVLEELSRLPAAKPASTLTQR
jgi:thiol:disulfide interchange protein DsbD